MTPATREDAALAALLDAIYHTYHYDFRAYSETSLRRRLEAARRRFACQSLAELQERTLRDPATFGELLGYLTVQVSDMFRDPPYFRALREHVVPYLQTYAALKVWVAGCATGEEAFALAILLDEEGLLERTLIYATDINPHSLAVAQTGIYELDRLPRFTANHLESGARASLSHYYTTAYGGALFDRRLRKAIVFSDHSLATDSAFAEVQLVSCRNVLIYFEKTLQEHALELLRGSLCHRGFLGLGMKESLRFSRQRSAFAEIDADTKIYQKL
ncbi:MAG TPA: CheR family methyltransferase [Kofleriaceae bacterium]|nr:CheR family methyltransferase [Kofleriaceae bacterium]